MNETLNAMYMQAMQGDGVLWGTNHAECEMLRRRASLGELRKLRRNLYVVGERWDALDFQACVRGLIRATQDQEPSIRRVYCLVTAAALWGLDVPFRQQNKEVLYVAGKNDPRRVNTIYRLVPISQPRTVKLDGIDVTDLPQTLRDCAQHLPFPDALAIVESALRTPMMRRYSQELRSLAREDPYFRFVYSHASVSSESVGESIAKATMVELGFQKPLQQVKFSLEVSPSERRDYRVDFLWFGNKGMLGGEFDGVEKYYAGGDDIHSQVSRTVARERQRDADLAELGVAHVVHFDYKMVINREEFRRHLIKAGVPHIRPGW